MDTLTIGDLMHLTREELCDLLERLEKSLDLLEAGTVARTMALESIVNIRRAMLMRGLHF